jgi:radical SAM family uncharacterized protein/radical SAM-linked protein
MHPKSIQDILPWVEQPSQYLGSEINHIRKDPAQVNLKILLAFPDLYEIGTSHFGIQILYHLINQNPKMLAERVFAPGLDMAERMHAFNLPLTSLESGTPVKQFDIIGFSLLYELNYTNILHILDLAGIPFLASQRNDDMPLIIAGGPCTVNPEPVADFFDAMVIGDGEVVIPELTKVWINWKENGGREKQSLLEAWCKIEGVYVPSFFKASYDAQGLQRVSALPSAPKEMPLTVARAISPCLALSDFPTQPIVPFGRPVHDRLRLEVARGCTRGCRFCQAGMIYRPVRERTMEDLLALSRRSLAATGYEDLSLLSLSTGDYGCIEPLMQQLMATCENEHIAVSFPSLRAGTMSPELMELVKKVRKTGFTIAVEAGSQRLRDVINKNIQETDIITTVEDAFRLGWQAIKLYFMIGLPTETEKDLEEMVYLVRTISKITGPKSRKGKVNVSVNTFIPKSHTPFQWVGQESLTESKEKIAWLRDRIRFGRVNFKPQQPKTSILEGLWARGDRRLSELLIAAYRKGCRFDGWSDRFRLEKWLDAIDTTGVNLDFYTTRTRALDEPLPWDHIDVGVTKAHLKKEWKNAITSELTDDCRNGECNGCGVCDFSKIEPVVFDTCKELPKQKAFNQAQRPEDYETIRLFYEKSGKAKYFGHLEMVSIFLRAIRRAGIRVLYSQGFHPMPKASFNDPLPIGMESMEESFSIRIRKPAPIDDLVQILNSRLPDGLQIQRCEKETKRSKNGSTRIEAYQVILSAGQFDGALLEEFKNSDSVLFQRKNRKGRVSEINLKESVLTLTIHEEKHLEIGLYISPGKTVRPATILSVVFHLTEDVIKGARVLKTVSSQK